MLGVTLSTEQHARRHRARPRRKGSRTASISSSGTTATSSERFDRIVSVGMFEHVGVNHYRTFFDKCATLLKPDGVMVLHSIGRFGPPAATNAFIRKYIFPGGYIPALSEVMPAIEKSGLMVDRRRDPAAALRRDAAGTGASASWPIASGPRRSMTSASAGCGNSILPRSEAAFRWQDLMVFQIQLTRRNDALPMTRDYIEKGEKALGHARDRASADRRRRAASRSEAGARSTKRQVDPRSSRLCPMHRRRGDAQSQSSFLCSQAKSC